MTDFQVIELNNLIENRLRAAESERNRMQAKILQLQGDFNLALGIGLVALTMSVFVVACWLFY